MNSEELIEQLLSNECHEWNDSTSGAALSAKMTMRNSFTRNLYDIFINEPIGDDNKQNRLNRGAVAQPKQSHSVQKWRSLENSSILDLGLTPKKDENSHRVCCCWTRHQLKLQYYYLIRHHK